MLAITITIEATVKGKLDETSMYLDDATENKLNKLMLEIEKKLKDDGLESVDIIYDFYDEELDDDLTPASEGISVSAVTEIWNADVDTDDKWIDTAKVDIEEDGKKYKKMS
jgi:hypothetical protein